MRKVTKLIGYLLSLIMVLLITAVVMLYLFINTDQLKDELSKQVAVATGRHLTVNGDIKLSIFPWLGVKLEDVHLSNAVGFTPSEFAQISEADVKVKLFPLMHGQIAVGKVELRDPQINLTINAKGLSNWQDISDHLKNKNVVKVSTSDQPPQKFVKRLDLQTLHVDSLVFDNAQINWNNQQKQQQYTLSSLQLQADNINFHDAFPIQIQTDLQSLKPAVSGNVNFTSRITLSYPITQLKINKFEVVANLQGKMFPAGAMDVKIQGDAMIDLLQQAVTVAPLTLQTYNLKAQAQLTGSHLLQTPIFTGSVQIPTFDPHALLSTLSKAADSLQHLSAKFDYTLSPTSMQLAHLQMKLDDTNVNGTVSVQNFADPHLEVNLHADQWHASKTETAKVNVVNNTQAATTTTALPTTPLPVALLRHLNLNGRIQVDELAFNNMSMSNVIMGIHAENGLINVTPMVARIAQGSYDGNLNIDARAEIPSLTYKANIAGVQVENFVNLQHHYFGIKSVKGLANADIDLNSTGTNVASLLQNLNGKATVDIKNGALEGVDMGYEMQKIQALAVQQAPKQQSSTGETQFSVLSSQATVHNGIVNNTLLMENPVIKGNGTGTLNLVNQEINYQLTGFIKASADESNKLVKQITQIPLPFKVTGTLANHTIRPDLMAITQYIMQQQVKKEQQKLTESATQQLGALINNKMGNGANANTANQLLNAVFSKLH